MSEGGMNEEFRGLSGLVDLVSRLRGPGGCPWDADQTHESLVQYLVEECYELIDAIEAGGRSELVEELGDVLYQVLFHADIAAHATDPAERFTVDDVADHMIAKMVGRHPHVFGESQAETAADVVAVWEDLKRAEKPERSSVLDGVPAGMPALALGQKLLAKAEKVAVTRDPADGHIASEQELGKALMGLVALAREQGWDAERAMREQIRALEHEVRSTEARA
ncbi:MAG TPA: MazG family protein [Microbacteriaceae bacterium]|nr:MazG family protein [Microbacteriaceae bacterium]